MTEATFWNTTFARALSAYAMLAFLVLWIGLAAALILHPDWLGTLWDWANSLPGALRILAWVFLTPLMATLWIWNASWPLVQRLLGLAAVAGWTALAVSSFLREWTR